MFRISFNNWNSDIIGDFMCDYMCDGRATETDDLKMTWKKVHCGLHCNIYAFMCVIGNNDFEIQLHSLTLKS